METLSFYQIVASRSRLPDGTLQRQSTLPSVSRSRPAAGTYQDRVILFSLFRIRPIS